MKAILVREFGGPEVLNSKKYPRQSPPPDNFSCVSMPQA